ncbi:MAG: hypothetical protein EBS51_09870 [Planctomycetia bacterium]|nr:hypothetical protein [Planctomycetia bacterium]
MPSSTSRRRTCQSAAVSIGRGPAASRTVVRSAWSGKGRGAIDRASVAGGPPVASTWPRTAATIASSLDGAHGAGRP